VPGIFVAQLLAMVWPAMGRSAFHKPDGLQQVDEMPTSSKWMDSELPAGFLKGNFRIMCSNIVTK
jgi:hypothetical protein